MSSKFLKTLESRRSIRVYKKDSISDSIIHELIDVARWAPSAHNAQPWRFVIVKDPDVKRKLAVAMGKSWDRDLAKDMVPLEKRQGVVSASINRLTQAPLIIVACLTMENMDKYIDRKRKRAEYIMGIQSVSAAIQNLLLAAHVKGLGGCWLCAPLFCQVVVRRVLKIPNHIEPVALITIGHPDEATKPLSRKPFEEIVHVDLWGKSP